MREPPNIELPDNPSKTQVLHAAICADNYSDWLLVQAMHWREVSHALFDHVDDLTEKHKAVMSHGRGLAVR